MYVVGYIAAAITLAIKHDAHMRSVGSAPKGDISTTHYDHAGACWDFSSVEQSLPITSTGALKISTHAVYYQAFYT